MATLEDRMKQRPGTFVTVAESKFIRDIREAAMQGVGYDWMQQMIEWEWQAKSPEGGAWGPEYFEKKIKQLEDAIK